MPKRKAKQWKAEELVRATRIAADLVESDPRRNPRLTEAMYILATALDGAEGQSLDGVNYLLIPLPPNVSPLEQEIDYGSQDS